MNESLTNLVHVKQWLGLTNSTDDALLTRMIGMASGYIRNWINRDITLAQYSDVMDGNNGQRLILGNFPITGVSALTINDQVIPEKLTHDAKGYIYHDFYIDLDGYYFSAGKNNVKIDYTAGFQTTDTLTVPSIAPYTVQVPLFWASDVSVVSGSFTLDKITGAPDSQEYSVTAGLYTFNAAQAGFELGITYGFIPGDIEQATIDLIGRKYRERDRIGLASKGLAGETTAFSQNDMSADTKAILQQYRKVFSV